MQEIENRGFAPSAAPWDNILLDVSPEARANMEDKLITDSDIREVIFNVNSQRDYFEDGDGLRTASLAKKVLTYWVDYRENTDGSFRVESAYCHRMHIGEEEKA